MIELKIHSDDGTLAITIRDTETKEEHNLSTELRGRCYGVERLLEGGVVSMEEPGELIISWDQPGVHPIDRVILSGKHFVGEGEAVAFSPA